MLLRIGTDKNARKNTIATQPNRTGTYSARITIVCSMRFGIGDASILVKKNNASPRGRNGFLK